MVALQWDRPEESAPEEWPSCSERELTAMLERLIGALRRLEERRVFFERWGDDCVVEALESARQAIAVVAMEVVTLRKLSFQAIPPVAHRPIGRP